MDAVAAGDLDGDGSEEWLVTGPWHTVNLNGDQTPLTVEVQEAVALGRVDTTGDGRAEVVVAGMGSFEWNVGAKHYVSRCEIGIWEQDAGGLVPVVELVGPDATFESAIPVEPCRVARTLVDGKDALFVGGAWLKPTVIDPLDPGTAFGLEGFTTGGHTPGFAVLGDEPASLLADPESGDVVIAALGEWVFD